MSKNEQPDVVEGIVTDEQIEDLIEHGQPSFHPILKVWREVLKPAETERSEIITGDFANRITQSYREINFADMPVYKELYYDHILELAKILNDEIATDDDCLKAATPEEDVKMNSGHYRQLLIDWQRAFVRWEKEWDCTADGAGIKLAAISEVHKMFFGNTGVVGYLQNIQFQYTEADQAELLAALEAEKAA